MDEEMQQGWAARPWVMAAMGAVAGLVIHWLVDVTYPARPSALEFAAAAAAVGAAAALFAFTFEPLRGRWAAIFALAAGAIVGLVIYWNGGPGAETGEIWRNLCVALAVAIAAPLFQTARDEGRWRFPYRAVHGHAWTNVVIWCAAFAFLGIVFALAWLLSALFELIGIVFIRDLLRENWFMALLAGAALGGAVGLLRERDRIVGLLQRVVVSVLAVLAPVLGAGLILFLLSLAFTGLEPLWEATKSTTPILLACVIGALILANAVIGNSDEEESRFAPLRFGAMSLGLAMLPFALIAAVSTGKRIDQYGFTPDRLWALVFVVIASAYGLAYLVALVRRRLDWADEVRPANLRLAFALCALALFLATPLLSFNAISTRDQVARLEGGRVSSDKFDWAALAFDFGEPGKAAARRLAKSSNATVRTAATRALKATSRWDVAEDADLAAARARVAEQVRVLPRQVPVPPELMEALDFRNLGNRNPTLFYEPGATRAVLVGQGCDDCPIGVTEVSRSADGSWRAEAPLMPAPEAGGDAAKERRRLGQALAKGEVEIREVRRRQVFVGGEAVGAPFE